MKRYIIFAYLLLIVHSSFGQSIEVPSLDWQFEAKKIESNIIKITISAEIPTDWMVVSEKKPSKMVPFQIAFDNEIRYEVGKLKQTKGKKFHPEKLAELFEEKIEVISGSVEYEILLKLKENQNIKGTSINCLLDRK